jgi:hypothetical protein
VKLTIELVPETSWYNNLRSILSKSSWDRLRWASYKKANNLCEICGGRGPKHPVECHEIWEYDNEKHIQKLSGMIALCPACHEVKHFGLARIKGREYFAKEHLMEINKWCQEDAEQYIEYAFETWQKRSRYLWKIDLTFLKTLGIHFEELSLK